MQTTLDNSLVLLGQGRLSLQSYLTQANLDQIKCSSEVWHINESSQKLAYLTHDFFRFFGKFPPPIAERFIRQLHNPEAGPVLDPMMGCGTTLVEALRLGRHSIGTDINPLFRMVAKTKTTFVEPKKIRLRLADLTKFRNAREEDFAQFIPKDRYLDHWFFPATQRQLGSIRAFIESLKGGEEDVIRLLKVAFASIIRQVSRASKGMGRMFFDPGIIEEDAFSVFEKKVLHMTTKLPMLKGLFPKPIVLENGDAKKTGLEDDSVGLVICHPPYFNLYRYSSIYRYELLWLGYDPKEIRKSEVREGFKQGKAELVKQYVNDMSQILSEVHRVLAPKCYCVLMIGDAIIKGERVPTTALVLDSLDSSDFQIDKIIVRIPKYTEASYAAAQRRKKAKVGIKLPDHLVLLKKV
jgi:tRNA G10  N-methylase Trm11